MPWLVDRRMMCGGLVSWIAGLRPGASLGHSDPIQSAANRAAVAPGVPGVIVQRSNDQSTETWTAGRVRCDGGPLITEHTPFHTASLGKLFTAAAILQQAERRTLDLDAPVVDYVGLAVLRDLVVIDGIDHRDDITVRHLLSHQSGVPVLDDAPSFQAAVLGSPERIWSPHDLLDAARGLKPTGPPGAQTLYSSTNYHLLGLVLEHATGVAYHCVIRRDVLDPLGLWRTHHSVHEWLRVRDRFPPELHHYVGDYDLTQHHPSFEFADGGFVSTAGDMTRFARLLAHGALFQDPSTWQTMLGPARQSGLHQGLGPMVEWNDGIARSFFHAGFWGLGLRAAVDGSWATLAALGQSNSDPWELSSLVDPCAEDAS
ncbi:MAG: serine hydrolase domain-containing protein [Pseudomonadota bacterium]